MTRSELLKEINSIIMVTSSKYLDEVIARKNKILDCYDSLDTSNRICENCIHYKFVPIFDEDTREWCCTEPEVSKFVSLPPKKYGCNEWRTK